LLSRRTAASQLKALKPDKYSELKFGKSRYGFPGVSTT